MRRRAAVLLYPGCVFFEIALATETLAAHLDIAYYTPDGRPHAASNGAVLQPVGSYADLANAEMACVLVPGGDPGSIVPDRLADACLHAAHARGALLAGICAGNLVLASAGLLRGVRATHNYTLEHASADDVAFTRPFWNGMRFERADVVIDGAIITAQPWAHRRYAAAVARWLGVCSEDDAARLVAYGRRSYDDGTAPEPHAR